jgi:hypothetical protein
MKHYVKVYDPLRTATQVCVPTGAVRENEAEFIPISRGYYQERFWAPQSQLSTDD